MKSFLLCLPVLFMLNSCSTDSEINQPLEPEIYNSVGTIKNTMPENPANKMNSKGKLYYEQLHEYSLRNKLPKSVSELSEQLRFVTMREKNTSLTSKSEIDFTDASVENIMLDPDNAMITIVLNSSLNQNSKNSLVEFLQTLNAQRALEFNLNYDFIVGYEGAVIADTTIAEGEKETLLTITSISRYSLYSEEERRDRDWETSVGSKMQSKHHFSKGQIAVIMIIALLPELF